MNTFIENIHDIYLSVNIIHIPAIPDNQTITLNEQALLN